MGRLLSEVITIEGKLTAESAIHVGSGDSEHFADMALVRDGRGRLYIPGTSLAGPLRAQLDDDFGRVAAETLFGPERQHKSDSAAASLLRIDDAPLLGPDEVEVRDGVGIDRYSGAAHDKIKYDRDVIPAGAAFDFRARLEIPADMTATSLKAWFAETIRSLTSGSIRLGGAKTRGLGAVRLKDGKAMVLAVGNKESLLDRLSGALPAFPDAKTLEGLLAAKAAPQPQHGHIDIEVAWESVTPVMMKSGRKAVSLVDGLPLATGYGEERRQLLTGAGIKGALRAHAERIMRTLKGKTPDFTSNLDFNGSLVVDVLVDRLFGARGGAKANGRDIARMGALSVEDCLPELLSIRRDTLDAIANTLVKDEDAKQKGRKLRELTKNTGWKNFSAYTHNAIDRWTGGVADGALFSFLEPDLTKGTIRMRIDLRLLDKSSKEAVALLLLVLRDFRNGKIPIGFGVNRGLGSLKVTSMRFTSKAHDTDLALSGEFDSLVLAESISKSWTNHLEKTLAEEQVTT